MNAAEILHEVRENEVERIFMLQQRMKQIEPILSARIGLGVIRRDKIETLRIERDYSGPFPDFNTFPILKKLKISKKISLSEVEQIDSSTIENLDITFKKEVGIFRFNLPNLKTLNIDIPENLCAKSLSDGFKIIIDISACVELEELEMNGCAGCEIKTSMLPKLKKIECARCKNYNFEMLKFTPNLTQLIASHCNIKNTDFLNWVPNLVSLDLSSNEIMNAENVWGLSNLQSLKLDSNPLDDEDKYKTLPCETIVTAKDSSFANFKFLVYLYPGTAYSKLKEARKFDPARDPVLQKKYDEQTDEEIFASFLASQIKELIEQYTSTKITGGYESVLKEKELTDYILQEYPFLEEFFAKGN